MKLFDLPPELLCQILEFVEANALDSLAATSPHLEPYVIQECKRSARCFEQEQAQISQRRIEITEDYAIGKTVLKDFLDEGSITTREYRMYRHTIHDSRDRDIAIQDVEDFLIKQVIDQFGRIKRTATRRLNKFMARLGGSPQRKRKRGHGWTRKKHHKKTVAEVA